MGFSITRFPRQDAKQNPRRFPAGDSCQVVRPSLEVAPSAEQHVDGVLVLELIQSCRLGNRWDPWAQNRARILLVQMLPVDVGDEGEVFDRGPDDVAAAVFGDVLHKQHATVIKLFRKPLFHHAVLNEPHLAPRS